MDQVGALLPDVRRLLAASPVPSTTADPMRFEVLDISAAFNSAPKGEGWDLSRLEARTGLSSRAALRDRRPRPRSLGRRGRRGGPETSPWPPWRSAGRWASLLFLHATTAEGRPSIHAGDQTHFPRDSSELLGYYEVRYADDVVDVHEIRYDETVGRWNGASRAPTTGRVPWSRARCPTAGTRSSGPASG